MDIKYLHLVKDGDTAVAYYYPTYSLLSINGLTYNILQSLQNGEGITEVARKYNQTTKDIQSILQAMESSFINRNEQLNFSKIENDKIVDRITLHVSNDCNLRCRYCYASGGSYKLSRGIMSKDTAEKFVEFCISHFSNVGHIVFFGGEPMLNLPIMEYVCMLFRRCKNEGRSSFLPDFSIVTNGTILDDNVVEFINKNISNITVSIDGLKDINDVNRIYANGKGSYDKIAMFIRTILLRTKANIRYEATFTQAHLDNHYEYNDIAKALETEFGIKGTVVPDFNINNYQAEDDSRLYNYSDISHNGLENLPLGFETVLLALANKRGTQICEVSRRIFAVAADGYIYPCHMNNGEKQNNLGSIEGRNVFNDPEFLSNKSSIYTLKRNEKCYHCWANNLCGGCAMKWFYDDDSKAYKEYPKEELCNLNIKRLDKVLISIARIRKDPQLWKKLLEKMYSQSA